MDLLKAKVAAALISWAEVIPFVFSGVKNVLDSPQELS